MPGNIPQQVKVEALRKWRTDAVRTDAAAHHAKAVNGSIVHMTAVFGFTLAGLVIQGAMRSTL